MDLVSIVIMRKLFKGSGEEVEEVRDRLTFSNKIQKVGLGSGAMGVAGITDRLEIETVESSEEV